jgi:hypothetical protein
VRKTDRNGSLIGLITYKHIESVDYSIKLLNTIALFGQRLKVMPSQKQPANTTSTSSQYSAIYSRIYSRSHYKSSDNIHDCTRTPPIQHFAPGLMNVQQNQFMLYQQLMSLANNNDIQQQFYQRSSGSIRTVEMDERNRSPTSQLQQQQQQHHHSHHHHRSSNQHQRHQSQHQNYNQENGQLNQQPQQYYRNNRHTSDNHNHRDRSRSPIDRRRR